MTRANTGGNLSIAGRIESINSRDVTGSLIRSKTTGSLSIAGIILSVNSCTVTVPLIRFITAGSLSIEGIICVIIISGVNSAPAANLVTTVANAGRLTPIFANS